MNRKALIGCGIFLLLFAALVGWAIYIVPKLIGKGVVAVKGAIQDATQTAAFEAQWRPPSGAPDASWFPKEIGDWRLTTQEPSTGIPRLKIDRPGQYAAYQSGSEVVEVNVLAANDLEKDALFRRAQDALSGGSRFSTSSRHHVMVRLNGDDYTRMWWIKDWLFVFHKRGQTDPEPFMQPYLKAIQAPVADGSPDKAAIPVEDAKTPETQRK